MTNFQFICKALAFFLYFVSFCLAELHQNENHPCVPESFSTSPKLRCGGVLTESSGTISYKPYTKIDKNERCVWTLGFQSSYRYDIDILYLGFPNDNQTSSPSPSLIFSTTAEKPTIYIPTTTGVFNTTTTTLFVTFSSGQMEDFEHYTGFILQYSRSSTSFGSTSYHKVLLPRVMVNYTNTGTQSVGTFVFPPENNTYPGTPYPVVYLEYGSSTCVSSGSISSCDALLRVYRFDRNNLTAPWQMFDRFCCGRHTASILGHDDLWMMTLRSGSQSTRKDFILFNERCHS